MFTYGKVGLQIQAMTMDYFRDDYVAVKIEVKKITRTVAVINADFTLHQELSDLQVHFCIFVNNTSKLFTISQ